ncbi:MAG: YdcF family protein [Gemmatimonadota bacterium]
MRSAARPFGLNPGRSRSGWPRRLALGLGLVLAGVVGLFLLRVPLLSSVANFLIVADSLERADLIYVMGGGLDARPIRAAELFRAGYAPHIATPYIENTPAVQYGIRLNGAVENALMLQRHGVPDSAIHLLKTPRGSTSTLDDARILASYLRQRGYRRVLVVTSEFHTRRSRWAVRQYVPDSIDVRMVPADEQAYTPRDWWQSELGMIDVAEEFLKFVHNYTQR